VLRRRLDRSGLGKEMLAIVVRVVGLVGIPDASREIALPGNSAALHMHAVNEVMFDVGSAQSPPQPQEPWLVSKCDCLVKVYKFEQTREW
jgi:hypothetical protein